MRPRGRHSAARLALRTPVSVAAALALVLLGSSVIGVQAANADDLGSGVLNLSKTTSATDVEPGQQFVYTLNFGCSSTTTGCVEIGRAHV